MVEMRHEIKKVTGFVFVVCFREKCQDVQWNAEGETREQIRPSGQAPELSDAGEVNLYRRWFEMPAVFCHFLQSLIPVKNLRKKELAQMA